MYEAGGGGWDFPAPCRPGVLGVSPTRCRGGGGEAGPDTAASLMCVLRGSGRESGVSAFVCSAGGGGWWLTGVWGKMVFKAPNPNYGGSPGSGRLMVLLPLLTLRAVLRCVWVLAPFPKITEGRGGKPNDSGGPFSGQTASLKIS